MTAKKVNMFAEAASESQYTMKKMKDTVVDGRRDTGGKKTTEKKSQGSAAREKIDTRIPVRTDRHDPATTMTLYIKIADKEKLKKYAQKRGMSSAAVIAELINKYCI